MLSWGVIGYGAALSAVAPTVLVGALLAVLTGVGALLVDIYRN